MDQLKYVIPLIVLAVSLAKVVELLVTKFVFKSGGSGRCMLSSEEKRALYDTRRDVSDLVKTTEKLAVATQNADSARRSCQEVLKELKVVHAAKDEDGAPMVYVPRSWGHTQEKIAETMQSIATTQKEIAGTLERVESNMDRRS